jgi:exodeoxyribonuclease-3
MRIATWNVNSLRVRLQQLKDWLARNPVDVIALQETKIPDADFPVAEFEALGLHPVYNGQRTYNGVAILARSPPADATHGIPALEDDQKRVIAATVAGVRIVDVYVPNGQTLDSPKYPYKLGWLESLRRYLVAELERHPRLVVLGDYNIAPEDRDVHDPAAWEGSVHVSPPERAALRALLTIGLDDCFRRFEQPEKDLFMVGLPRDGLPEESRASYRPDPGERRDGRKVCRVSHRQVAARDRTALRPRTGARRV